MTEWERHKKGNEQLGAHFRRARGYNEGGEEAQLHSVQRRRRRIVPAFLGGVRSVGRGIFVGSNCGSDATRLKTYLRYVLAAVHGNDALGCTITPKVHMMIKHVAFQMRYIWGGWEIKWKIGWSNCQDASATAFLHGPEPGHPSVGAGEGEFMFVPSQCDCSHKCDECREQAFFFCREG